ncbi:MAG: hypothetical protein MI757_07780, partial [Pirellulales bacterium]|nr:hypothetical protein [Pirellulales bacterium]
MANWDFVFAYDERATDWLTEQGYPHPPVQSGNRLPTTGDVKWAVGSRATSIDDYPLIITDFDWDDDDASPDDAFKLRGDLVLELELLIRLC